MATGDEPIAKIGANGELDEDDNGNTVLRNTGSGDVILEDILAGLIGTNELSDDAVTAAKIAAAAVDSGAIASDAVGVDELQAALGTTESEPIPGTTHLEAASVEDRTIGNLGVGIVPLVSQTIPDNTITQLDIRPDDAVVDGAGEVDPSADEITISDAGLYRCRLQVGFAELTDQSTLLARIEVNSETYTSYTSVSGGNPDTAVTEMVLDLEAGDVVRFYTYQTSGGSVDTRNRRSSIILQRWSA